MPSTVYRTGKSLSSNERTLDSLCGQAARMLGLVEYERPILCVLPQQELKQLGYNGGYLPKERRTTFPPAVNEGDGFHECVHHVLNCNGLMLTQDMGRLTFHELLVDETMAEFATARKFGYTKEVIDFDIDIAYRGVLAAMRVPGANGISEGFRRAATMAHQHREAHARYLGMQTAREAAFASIGPWIPPDEDPHARHVELAVRFLAYTRAKQLLARGVQPAEMARLLQADVLAKRSPEEIYYGTILPLAAR